MYSAHFNCRLFGIISSSFKKILLDAQISEYKKLSTAPNAYDTPENNINPSPTAPPFLHILQHNPPLSLVP